MVGLTNLSSSVFMSLVATCSLNPWWSAPIFRLSFRGISRGICNNCCESCESRLLLFSIASARLRSLVLHLLLSLGRVSPTGSGWRSSSGPLTEEEEDVKDGFKAFLKVAPWNYRNKWFELELRGETSGRPSWSSTCISFHVCCKWWALLSSTLHSEPDSFIAASLTWGVSPALKSQLLKKKHIHASSSMRLYSDTAALKEKFKQKWKFSRRLLTLMLM